MSIFFVCFLMCLDPVTVTCDMSHACLPLNTPAGLTNTNLPKGLPTRYWAGPTLPCFSGQPVFCCRLWQCQFVCGLAALQIMHCFTSHGAIFVARTTLHVILMSQSVNNVTACFIYKITQVWMMRLWNFNMYVWSVFWADTNLQSCFSYRNYCPLVSSRWTATLFSWTETLGMISSFVQPCAVVRRCFISLPGCKTADTSRLRALMRQ